MKHSQRSQQERQLNDLSRAIGQKQRNFEEVSRDHAEVEALLASLESSYENSMSQMQALKVKSKSLETTTRTLISTQISSSDQFSEATLHYISDQQSKISHEIQLANADAASLQTTASELQRRINAESEPLQFRLAELRI